MIYLDMDGVLADFNGSTNKILKEMGCQDDWKVEVEKPYWGMIGLSIKDIYARLEVLPDAMELVEFCLSQTDDVEILTAIPRRAHFPDAVDHKREWINKNFPMIKHVNYGPYAKDKQYHCRRNSDILIDDSEINIEQWNAKGGIGILHMNTALTIATYKGKVINGLYN